MNYLLDILDGDLARMLGLDSDLGKFEDINSDNFAVVILMLALINKGLIMGLLGGYYIFAATLSWWLSVIRKIGSVRSDWLFKPEASATLHILRFWIVPILMIIYAFWRTDVFSVAISVVSVFLTIIMVCDYYQIVKQGEFQK